MALEVAATAKGKSVICDRSQWDYYRMIELSVLGNAAFSEDSAIDSVKLFKLVKIDRKNALLADVVIAKVIERLVYWKLLEVRQTSS